MKKILYTFVIISIFAFIPNVFANSYNGLDLSLGNNVRGYNWASTSSYSSISLTRSDQESLHYYFTNNTVSTGTYGISFLVNMNQPLLANHYYRLVYIVGNGMEDSCKAPGDWSMLRFSATASSSLDYPVSYTRVFQNVGGGVWTVSTPSSYINYKVCSYFVTVKLDRNAFVVNMPVNSQNSINSIWYFYGYYIEDLGDADSLTATDLQNSISNMQNTLTQNNNTNTQNIINNQNQNAQQAHTDAQNTQNAINNLKDDTVNSNTGKSFFDNFSDNSHGLSGIITAPLNIIRQLINVNPTSCSALSTTYHNKTISMPCGAIFWGHTGFSQFNTFYNMVVGGAFCYLIIKDLFLTIEKLKDPDNDKVEVMDL